MLLKCLQLYDGNLMLMFCVASDETLTLTRMSHPSLFLMAVKIEVKDSEAYFEKIRG